jgi:hypothetical protein
MQQPVVSTGITAIRLLLLIYALFLAKSFFVILSEAASPRLPKPSAKYFPLNQS